MPELQPKDWIEILLLVGGFGVAWERLRSLSADTKNLWTAITALRRGQERHSKEIGRLQGGRD